MCLFLNFFKLASLQARDPNSLYLNFEQCVDLALKNNDEIHAAEQSYYKSQAQLKQASPHHIPIIEYKHRIGPIPSNLDDVFESISEGEVTVFNNTEIKLGAPLTTFGKIKTAQELAQIGIKASWFEKTKKEDEVIHKIYEIYQGILLARELLALGSDAKKTLNDRIESLEKKEIKDQIEILKLKVALFEVERRVEEALTKEKLAVAALKLQMGLELDVDFNIASKSLLPRNYQLKSLDSYVEQAQENRPEYQLLELGVQATGKKLKLEKLEYVPNLGYGGFFKIGRAPGLTGDDENDFVFTKGGLGIELEGKFDFIKTSSKIKQAEADFLKVIYQKRAAIRGLELDIRKTYLDVLSSKRLMQKAAEEKKIANQLVFLTKSNIDIGIGTKKEYTESLQSYLIFQGREFESIYNYNVAISALLLKTGQLNFLRSKMEENQ